MRNVHHVPITHISLKIRLIKTPFLQPRQLFDGNSVIANAITHGQAVEEKVLGQALKRTAYTIPDKVSVVCVCAHVNACLPV